MKGTSIFQFKSWPKIHQPLPRTPRESKQLLNALTSSFRRQLDDAYPAPNTSSHKAERPPLNTLSSAHATDKHLHNILENPLFRIVPPKASSSGRVAVRGNDEQKRLADEPMKVFDERAAAGTVTMPFLINCLVHQRRLVGSPRESDMAGSMRTSRTGSRIVEWFWASDGSSRQELLRSTQAISPLARFMVSEGLHETIIDWLRLLLLRDLGGQNGQMTESAARQAFGSLFFSFVDAELRLGGGFASALKLYLRVCHMHATSTYQQPEGSAQSMLLSAGAHLNKVYIETKPSIENLSAYTYEEYMEVILRLTNTGSLLFAFVSFYHPHKPDPRPLAQFVEKLTPAKMQKYSNHRQELLLRVTCDVLRSLIDQNNIQDATILAHHMQQLLPEQEGATSVQERRSNVRKERNTDQDLLNRLEIGLA